jgi:ABC-2 type transport system ATP-binding protein
LLAINHLNHTYPDGTQALSDVSLTAPPGLFGLLGPNGAGKSTLMRILATLQRPTSGSLQLGEIDIVAQPERLRRVLGYLPQEFGVYPHVTVEDMLDHLAVLKGFARRAERRDLTAGLLRQVNLWDARHKRLTDVSGGMRRRFGIAQALIGSPRLVIVDEPTAGLDPDERNRCLDLLAAISDTVVVLLSTHIVADVADLCPRLAMLIGGRIVLEGTPSHLTSALAGRLWRRTIEREDLPAYRSRFQVISARLQFGRTLVHGLDEGGDRPKEAELVEPSLEDVYFATLHRVGQQTT